VNEPPTAGDANAAQILSTLDVMGHRGFVIIGLATLGLLAAACGDSSESNVVLETTPTTESSTETSEVGVPTTSDPDEVEVETSEVTEPTDPPESTTTAPQASQGTTLTDSARVSTLGLGPVFMGDTLAEVGEKVGAELLGDEAGSDMCRYYVLPGGPPGVQFMVAFDRIARVDIDDPSVITTRSGAGIGSTRQEVLDLLGDKVQVSPHPDGVGEFLTFVPTDEKDKNLRIVFETNADNVVVNYRTGQLPEVDYQGGCP
jgi:hypothetical protein